VTYLLQSAKYLRNGYSYRVQRDAAFAKLLWPLVSIQSLAMIIQMSEPELSMGWVDPWVGLGRDFSVFGGLGWVNYSKSTKNLKGFR